MDPALDKEDLEYTETIKLSPESIHSEVSLNASCFIINVTNGELSYREPNNVNYEKHGPNAILQFLDR